MSKIYYTTILLLTFLLSTANVFSQDNESKCKIETDFSADLMSRYVWRGLQFGGTSPSIQPGLAFSTKGFEFGVWGAYSLGGINPSQELDLHLSYTFLDEDVTATVTDYYFPNEVMTYDYFDFKKASTGHVMEGMVSFNGTDKIPFSFTAAMNFWGADAAKLISDSVSSEFNKSDGIQYSNYFELGYSKSFENFDFSAFAGFTLTNPLEADTISGFIGESAYYGGGSGLINVGVEFSKEIKISSDFSLPVKLQLITNPRDKKIYFVFGLTF